MTNDRDEDTNEPIISEGFDIYRIEVKSEGNSFKILSQQKIDLTEADTEIIEFINSNPNQSVELRSYDDDDAVDWAFDHWDIPPTQGYYDYTNSGGDCTNFLSHCLKHGGWVMINAWHWLSNGLSCDYNMTTCKRSPSWTGANPMFNFLNGSSRVDQEFVNFALPDNYWTNSQLNVVDELKKGDIAQYKVDGTYRHSMLLTKKAALGPLTYFTYQNSTGNDPRKNKRLDEILGSHKKLCGFHVNA
jgi:hypothetical protein